MKPNTPPHFRCIACTKIYRWRPERAGRKVLCVCGLIMRCAKTPDGKPTSLGHKAPLIKPSEARVHAQVGENAVINLTSPETALPEWVEESTTLNLNPSDIVVDDIPESDLDLHLEALTDVPASPTSTASATRPEAPAPFTRPEAPTPRPGSAAGLASSSAATRQETNAPNAQQDPTSCPHCKAKFRPGAVLCIQCGTPLKPATSAPTATQGTGSGFFAKMFKAVVKPKGPATDA